MDDRTIMENLLSGIKGACGLMMHGTVESSTPNVTSTFKTNLNDALEMQNQVYSKMSEKGWYSSQQVEQQKIDQVKQKFATVNA